MLERVGKKKKTKKKRVVCLVKSEPAARTRDQESGK
jgi:hypothetical protein